MKTIGILAQKGGTGKTTLGVHLAVQAAADGLDVLLVDIDPQANATMWWRRRDASEPVLLESDGAGLRDLLRRARQRHYDLAIVDTAPHDSDDAKRCARLADRVIIPTRPAILDLDAIGASTRLASEVKVTASIVLNACPPKTRRGEPRIVSEAREALSAYGVPVSPASVSQRAVFGHALIDGRVARELDPASKAASEIERLWTTIKKDLAV